MNSIELLKQELAEQKAAIETKKGFVSVANTNVSPAEITEGIKTIPVVDLSSSTATEADVLLGKTFYSGDETLRTGTFVVPEDSGSDSSSDFDANFIDYVVFGKNTAPYPDIELHVPDFTNRIKDYLFYKCPCKCDVYLNSSLSEIGTHAFNAGTDTTLHNFENTNMIKVELNACRETKGIDLSALPDSITTMGNYAFADCAKYSNSLTLPASLSSLGSYAFSCSDTTPVNSIDLSKVPNLTYSLYLFQYIQCLGDVTIPEGITALSAYFNYNGSMKTVTFPTTLTKLNSYTFNAKDFVPLEDLITESYTFQTTTPPAIPNSAFCARLADRTSNPVKFYVPDESLEAYKSLAGLSAFSNNIFPVSQKV